MMKKLNILSPIQGIYCHLSSDAYLPCIFSFLLVFMDFKSDTERLLYRSNPVLKHCSKCQLLSFTELYVKNLCCFACCKSLMQQLTQISPLHDTSGDVILAWLLTSIPFGSASRATTISTSANVLWVGMTSCQFWSVQGWNFLPN